MRRLIYVVDDEPLQLHYLQAALRKENYQVETFSDPYDVLAALKKRMPHAMVVDLIMPQLSGTELITEIRKTAPKLPLIAVTAYPEIETAMGAIRAGANDYLKKPFQTAELQLVVERLLATVALKDSLDAIAQRNASVFSHDAIIGESPAIQALKDQLRLVVDIPGANVLISGEAGTGKSFLARVLHYANPDVMRRLVEVNCATMSPDELQAELFGRHIPGSGGSTLYYPALCEEAEGGTILLDSIDRADIETQEKLYTRLTTPNQDSDAPEDQPTTCRVIGIASLQEDKPLDRNDFYPALFDHLSLFTFSVPPLRERGKDVLSLARKFINSMRPSSSVPIHGLTPAAERALLRYDWPGNIRELKSVIERAIVVTRTQQIDEKDLHIGATYHTKSDESVMSQTLASLRELEIDQIKRVLTYTQGDVTKAAHILGISRKSLWERRKRFSIE